ncbi:nuclear valosin-containing protein-like [Sinocyclocheilus rhinocerous]|uniref:nuclear valosin-containing protein-like n=1 Tax=Sinocyclocheilus rhinocerous TaxID=307959 RepID=UPI0007BA2E32|nr:PREDICTED: nuclear valosin-containing protein-like [Sinocyclocheilus rhinocerous]
MNSSLTSLYQRAVTPQKRTGNREQENIFIDLCEEESSSQQSVFVMRCKSQSHELQFSSVKFEDFGGSEETLEEVCKLLIHTRHPEVYQRLGVVPPRGFLLHGPPGCGKTLLAQAVAGEVGLPMLKVSALELVSGVSGKSEQKLQELFEQAIVRVTP